MQKQKKRVDKRRWVVGFLACVLAVALLLPLLVYVTTPAGAVTQSEINSLKQNAAQLESQKNEMSTKIAALSQDKEKALEEKQALDEQNALLQEQIDTTNKLIEQYAALIQEKEAELEEAKTKEKAEYELFCQRVRSMEESGSDSYIAVLFGAKDFSDLLDRVTMIQEVVDYDQSIMEMLAETRQNIADKKAELESAKQEQELAKAQLKEKETELEEQIQVAIDLVTKMEAQADEYQTALQKLAAEEDAISAEIDQKVAELDQQNAAAAAAAAAAAEAAKKAAASSSGSSGSSNSSNSSNSSGSSGSSSAAVSASSGGFLWPLNGYTSISSSFGGRIHPLSGVWKVHNGVDIPAPSGTPIRATKSGQVIISSYGSSYGNYVSISHGGGTSSLYAHMSRRAVSAGETVQQGQIIGYVGTTGSSTGNHLHFEVKIGGSRVNPLGLF